MRIRKGDIFSLVLIAHNLRRISALPWVPLVASHGAKTHQTTFQTRLAEPRSFGDPGMLDVYIVVLADGYDLNAHLVWLSGTFHFLPPKLLMSRV